MCCICILPLYFRSWGYVSHQVAVTPCCPQCLSFCSNKRADSVHYPSFMGVCVCVLKCEGFVNAPILLWQEFYLTDTSRRHSLFWSRQCSPQHSSGQLYLFSLIIEVLTLRRPGKPVFFFFPEVHYTHHNHTKGDPLCFNSNVGECNVKLNDAHSLEKEEHCNNEKSGNPA